MQKAKIIRALIRPTLLFGCERKPVIILGILSAVIFMTLNPMFMLIGVLIFISGVWALRKAAKKDPMLLKLYWRHIKYSKVLRSKPSIDRFL